MSVQLQALQTPLAEPDLLDQIVERSKVARSEVEHERARVAQALAQAQEAGFEQGRRDGERVAAERLTEVVARITRDQQVQQQAARDAVGALALAVVQKLASSLGASEVVPKLVEQAVIELLPQRSTRVRVGPEAMEATRERLAKLGLSADVRADETLGAFDCVIDSVTGQHVVSLDSQLAAIGRALGLPERDIERDTETA